MTAQTTNSPVAKVCDNASVGVLIRDADDRWLLFTRATPPIGIAPSAGHVFDDHTVYTDGALDEGASYRAAAVAEVSEELGLTVQTLTYMTGGWRTAACRRAPGLRGVGHEWRVYTATVTGDLAPSQRETRDARWYTRTELQGLADRTAAYAWGQLTDAEFAGQPGIEPVWCRWLHTAEIVTLTTDDLDAIEEMLTTRALRGRQHGVTVRIDHQLDDGTTQTLWGEADDWEHLERLQETCRWAHGDNSPATISLYARLTLDGTDAPRVFYAARTTLTEVELP